jgi:HSP20 family protein
MATTSWNPWTELETFTRELQRAFDCPTTRPSQKGNGHQESWKPRMDVSETDAAYIIEADVPGLTIQDITVQLEGATLEIAGERQSALRQQGGHFTHSERVFGKFQRTFSLPTAVNADEIQAAYTNGVLTVTVPKASAARTRRINVQTA